MTRPFIRIVAVFLLPCLFADSTLATGVGVALKMSPQRIAAEARPFDQEALVPAILWTRQQIAVVRSAPLVRRLAAAVATGAAVGFAVSQPELTGTLLQNPWVRLIAATTGMIWLFRRLGIPANSFDMAVRSDPLNGSASARPRRYPGRQHKILAILGQAAILAGMSDPSWAHRKEAAIITPTRTIAAASSRAERARRRRLHPPPVPPEALVNGETTGSARALAIRDWLLQLNTEQRAVHREKLRTLSFGDAQLMLPRMISQGFMLVTILSETHWQSRFTLLIDTLNRDRFVVLERDSSNRVIDVASGSEFPRRGDTVDLYLPGDFGPTREFFKNVSRALTLIPRPVHSAARTFNLTEPKRNELYLPYAESFVIIKVRHTTSPTPTGLSATGQYTYPTDIPDDDTVYPSFVCDPAIQDRPEPITSAVQTAVQENNPNYLVVPDVVSPSFLGYATTQGYGYWKRLSGTLSINNRPMAIYRSLSVNDPDVLIQAQATNDGFMIEGVNWKVGPQAGHPVIFKTHLHPTMLVTKYSDEEILSIPENMRAEFTLETFIGTHRASAPMLQVDGTEVALVPGPQRRVRDLGVINEESKQELQRLKAMTLDPNKLYTVPGTLIAAVGLAFENPWLAVFGLVSMVVPALMALGPKGPGNRKERREAERAEAKLKSKAAAKRPSNGLSRRSVLMGATAAIGLVAGGTAVYRLFRRTPPDDFNVMPVSDLPALPKDEASVRKLLRQVLADRNYFHDEIEAMALLPGWTREELHEGVRRLDQLIASGTLEPGDETFWFTVRPGMNPGEDKFEVNLKYFEYLIRYGWDVLLHESIHMTERQRQANTIYIDAFLKMRKLSQQKNLTESDLAAFREASKTLFRQYFLIERDAQYYQAAYFAVQAARQTQTPSTYTLQPLLREAERRRMTLQHYLAWLRKTKENERSWESLFLDRVQLGSDYGPGGFTEDHNDAVLVGIADKADITSAILFHARSTGFDPNFVPASAAKIEQDPVYKQRYLEWAKATFLRPEDLVSVPKAPLVRVAPPSSPIAAALLGFFSRPRRPAPPAQASRLFSRAA